ncbi:hypothetical protein F4859DRAFT_487298 [Xylaria cf. heliscus]|nr:hypothetical protein F4859DRAFT_487298 [Xylaria cf. heliscus]
MNAGRQKIDDAYPTTCNWLFSTTEFEKWRCGIDLSAHNGVLWIKGKPGAGKSTLMNHTLSYLEKGFNDHLIVAYFFNARGGTLENSPLGMMQSIVYQLVSKDDALSREFLHLYREKQTCNGRGLQWEQSELKKFIQSITKQPHLQLKPILLLVDALDECIDKEVRDIVDFFETLSVNSANVGAGLKICLSSRHYPCVSMKKNLELTVEMRQEHGADIAAYIREKLNTEDHSLEYQIRKKADGVFMWVVLVVAMLNKAYDEGRVEVMQKTLDEVPEGLEGIFNTVLAKGDSDKTELVKMLQWVLFSQRPLTPEELYIATISESPPSYKVIQRRIINSSKGLIEIRKEKSGNESVQFIHESVKYFLCRNRKLETLDPTLEPDAASASHGRLWAFCRSYIARLDTTSTKEEHTIKLLCCHQFADYAISYIFCHADEALSNHTTGLKLDHDIAQWLEARDAWLPWLLSTGRRLRRTPPVLLSLDYTNPEVGAKLVYILARPPYPNLFDFTAKNACDITSQIFPFGSALQTVANCQDYKSVKLLLERGADVNSKGGLFSTAPEAASSSKNYDIIDFLIKKGADVNARGGEYGNALQAASHPRHYDVTKLLPERGAKDGPAIHQAFTSSNSTIVDNQHTLVPAKLLQTNNSVLRILRWRRHSSARN